MAMFELENIYHLDLDMAVETMVHLVMICEESS